MIENYDRFKKEIVKLYNSGLSSTNIGKEFGVCSTTVIKYLRLSNVVVGREKLNENDIERAIRLYDSGMGTKTIGEMFGVTIDTVRKYLRKSGVRIRSEKVLLDAEIESKIKELYESGIGSPTISRKLGINIKIILRSLRNQDVPLRSISESRKLVPRKYWVDESFFDEIDSKEKTYILGLIYSDGNICNPMGNKWVLRISLAEYDKDILVKLQKSLGGSIYFSNRKDDKKCNTYNLNIHSEKLCKRLVELGCPPRKSKILKYPTWIQDEFQSHFIRGIFDGDGCITKSNQGSFNIQLRFHISGTYDICLSTQKILKSVLNIKGGSICVCPGCFRLAICGNNQVPKIMDWLYNSAGELYLKRKKIKYEELLSSVEKYRNKHK